MVGGGGDLFSVVESKVFILQILLLLATSALTLILEKK